VRDHTSPRAANPKSTLALYMVSITVRRIAGRLTDGYQVHDSFETVTCQAAVKSAKAYRVNQVLLMELSIDKKSETSVRQHLAEQIVFCIAPASLECPCTAMKSYQSQ